MGPGAKKTGVATSKFVPLGIDDPKIPPLEGEYVPGTMPVGTLLDLTALESLQVTMSHIPVTGEVHYHLQSCHVNKLGALFFHSCIYFFYACLNKTYPG